MTNEKAMRYAQDKLAVRRAIAQDKLNSHLAALYSRYPTLKQLDDEVVSTGALALESVSRGDIPMSEASRLVREAGKRRDDFVVANSIKYDCQPYYCHICSDTGYLLNRPCECLKKLQSEYLASTINAESQLSLCRFDTFNLEYYPTTRMEGALPRSVMRQNLKICADYAKTVPAAYKNLLLMGGAGLGKTHLALSVAAEVIDAGYNVIYCSAANIFLRIQSEYFESKDETTLNSLKECDLLILDDLGAEYMTTFVKSALYDLVNTRDNARRCTIYTTNITDGSIFELRYGEGVASRLCGCCEVLTFIGNDIRLLKGRCAPDAGE